MLSLLFCVSSSGAITFIPTRRFGSGGRCFGEDGILSPGCHRGFSALPPSCPARLVDPSLGLEALGRFSSAVDPSEAIPAGQHDDDVGKVLLIPVGNPWRRGAMSWDAYYAEIQSAYDRIASTYDETIGRALVSRRAKDLAVSVISRISPPGSLLLDVGCYTGTEGLLLARRGYRVVGVDLSPKMIELSRSKARKLRLADRIQFEVARASDLSSLRVAGLGPFDTAYSVYGTLNFEPRLDLFKHSLSSILRPGGALVVGMLNPTVLYELLFGPFFLRFAGYRKLAKHGVRIRVGSGDESVQSFLYSMREFGRLLEPEFSQERVWGVHILYPPPRPRKGGGPGLWWIARAMDRLEEYIESRFPFSGLGFFSLAVFRKLEDLTEE